MLKVQTLTDSMFNAVQCIHSCHTYLHYLVVYCHICCCYIHILVCQLSGYIRYAIQLSKFYCFYSHHKKMKSSITAGVTHFTLQTNCPESFTCLRKEYSTQGLGFKFRLYNLRDTRFNLGNPCMTSHDKQLKHMKV